MAVKSGGEEEDAVDAFCGGCCEVTAFSTDSTVVFSGVKPAAGC